MDLSALGKLAYKHFFSGTVSQGGSWGGPECAAAVPRLTHLYETIVWLVLCSTAWYLAGFSKELKRLKKEAEKCVHSPRPRRRFARPFELIVGLILFAMWVHIVYFKYNMNALINLLQPCHMDLLVQALILLFDTPTSLVAQTLLLPMTTGTLSAMFFPDTSGLNQPFEELHYWLQHYVIQVVPFYLLLKRDAFSFRQTNIRTVLLGAWFILISHWTIFESIDYYFSVNVQFMLCASPAMWVGMSVLPPQFIWPSYRTVLCAVMYWISIGLSYVYILMVWPFVRREKDDGKKKR